MLPLTQEQLRLQAYFAAADLIQLKPEMFTRQDWQSRNDAAGYHEHALAQWPSAFYGMIGNPG